MKNCLYNLLIWLMLGTVFVTVYSIYLGGTVLSIISNFKTKPVETSIILTIVVVVVALINVAINKYISRQ